MSQVNELSPKNVFKYFCEMSAIPRGSGNMKGIADYVENFAKENSLRSYRDEANNVVIYKNASAGYENTEPVILQGHLDIVCQKEADREIDFERDGLDIYFDGEYVRARGTTLGADNGIAAAMILAILASNDVAHPAIEAVFTTDEEIGMLGAMALDMSVLSAKKLINLDSEEDDVLTVSCAGGSDFCVEIPTDRKTVKGTLVTLELSGLLGGHSGIEIDKGRVNADILAGRVLSHIKTDFDMISVDGGNKDNAIPLSHKAVLCTAAPDALTRELEEYLALVKKEISEREGGFEYKISAGDAGEYAVFSDVCKKDILYALLLVPNGVVDMSASIKGLVETSLNLGVLATSESKIRLGFALRSNKQSALVFLEEKMVAFFSRMNCEIETGGHYPPWEYKEDSALQKLFCECYKAQRGTEPKVEAIHAGLECGTFASKIDGLDCIAIGPTMFDVHTTGERLLVSSVEQTYELLLDILKKSK